MNGAQTSTEARLAPRSHFAHHEMLSPRKLRIAAAISTVVVAMFVIAKPIGTHTLTELQRCVYLVSVAAFSFPLYYSLMTVTLYCTRFQPPLASAVAVAVMAAVVSVPVTAMAYLYPLLFHPGYQIPDVATVYVTVAGSAMSACLLCNHVIFQRIRDIREAGAGPLYPGFRGNRDSTIGDSTIGEPKPSGDSAPNRSNDKPPENPTPHRLTPPASPTLPPVRSFVERLPADLGDEIIYLKTEGHYLRVYTKAGTSRLLLRFADAVAELSNLGMQVHRSYWVAHNQVVGMVNRDHRMVLRLTGDYEVPVRRTYVRAVKAAIPR